MNDSLPSIKILGTKVNTASKDEVLEYIFKCIDQKGEKAYIVTPNPEILVHATRSKSFQEVLNHATVSLADGVGVIMAGSILKNVKIPRITGTDMMVELCQKASKQQVSVGFLGGRDGVARLTSECLVKKYPNLRVNYVGEEWNIDNVEDRSLDMKDRTGSSPTKLPTPNSHIDILFVAYGFPKQEEWIANNLQDLPVTVAMGVGGAFDYVSGKIPRAPKVLRDLGLEWAYRLLVQPWRIKRQLALPIFMIKILQEKLRVGAS